MSKSYKVERDEVVDGLRCVTILSSSGHRCGYVGLPDTHPLYGVGYSEETPALLKLASVLPLKPLGDRGSIIIFLMALSEEMSPRPDFVFDVHGGITYSGGSETDYPVPTELPLWWFGFDCAHVDDSPFVWTSETTWQETLRLAAQLNTVSWPEE